MTDLTPVDEAANELSFQEELFCREYMDNGENGTRAAQAAGYQGNDATLAVQASRMLKRPKVRKYLRALKDERLRELHMTPDAVLAELAALAGFRLGDFIDDYGFVDFAMMDERAKAAIKSVKRKPGQFGTSLEVEGPDKLKALELLMQHLGMIKTGPQTAVQVNVDFGDRIAQRRAAALEG